MAPSFADGIGSIGVALLLLAFFLNLSGKLPASSKAYAAINAIGAGLACLASYLIGFLPFVVLEGTWCAVAVYGLVRPGAGEATEQPQVADAGAVGTEASGGDS